MGYIYLLRLYPNSPTKTFKLGKTKREFHKRYQEYVNDGCDPKPILFIECSDCDTAEKELLKIFNEKFQQLKTTGREYFAGDENEMKTIILCYFGQIDVPVIEKNNQSWLGKFVNWVRTKLK